MEICRSLAFIIFLCTALTTTTTDLSTSVCSEWGICGQICTNNNTINEMYQCSCADGFQLESDQYSCKPENEPPYMMFSNRHEIRRVDLDNATYVSLVSGLWNAVALDFYYNASWIFWTDLTDKKIFRGKILSNSINEITPIVDAGLEKTEGLAVDWIGRHIYWADSRLGQIKVANLDGTRKTTLIAGYMTSPRAIVLDPRVGSLFWTDWDPKFPRIETCSMAGDRRKTIFNINEIFGGGWPNGLTIDYDFKRLYWIDARSDSVHTIDYEGRDHRLILKTHEEIKHPYALTLFGNYVYWTDWGSRSIMRTNKFFGTNISVIQQMTTMPFDLKVYHSMRQPYAQNPCANNGGCSHLCLIGFNYTAKCLCPDLKILSNGGKYCTENDPVYIIVSNRHEIKRVDLNKSKYTSLVSGLRSALALDFYYKESWIFWTDVIDKKIFRGKMLSNSLKDITPIIDIGPTTTEGLAVDWIGQHIYWVDNFLDQIEVAKFDGSQKTTLISGNMTNPRAIVLDPRMGSLFWTDWDPEFPRIETCSMAGEQRKTLFNISGVSGGGWPNGLTIDYKSKRLYWIDARSDSIHTIDYAGRDHRLILKNHGIQHPFALTLFDNYIYWTDWGTSSIMRVNKLFGTNVSVTQKMSTQPFNLLVYHPMRQPYAPNPCANNGGCSHLCLIGYNDTAICRCPHLKKLHNDGKKCIPDNTFLLFARSNAINGLDLSNTILSVFLTITYPYVDRPTAVDYDSNEEKLYWADGDLNVINCADNDGSNVETIIDSGLSHPECFAIDWMSGNMYFCSLRGNEATISVAKLRGNGAYRVEIISTGLTKPNSLEVFPSEGFMFWSDIGNQSDQAIFRSKMDGSDAKPIINKLAMPASLKLDMETKMLYWVNRGNDSIMTCDINGTGCSVIQNNLITKPLSLTLASGGKLYVASDDAIVSINITGDQYMLLRDKTPRIDVLQVYDMNMRNGTNTCSSGNGGCQQLCLPVGVNQHVCKCTAGFKLTDKYHCKGIESFLIYATEKEIHGIQLDDTGNMTEVLPLISQISMTTAVDFHAEKNNIFWMDRKSQSITSIRRDLIDRKVVVDVDIGDIVDIAVDWIAENLYWVDNVNNIIEVVKLNNSSMRYIIVHDDQDKPLEVVVDPYNGYIFWINSANRKYSIKKGVMDGSSSSILNIPNLTSPKHLAIDYETNTLYWWDEVTKYIRKFNINCGQRVPSSLPQVDACLGITVYKKNIYWAQLEKNETSSIKYTGKVGGGEVRTYQESIEQRITDIKVFDKLLQKDSGSDNPCRPEFNGGCEQFCFFNPVKDGNTKRTCACSNSRLNQNGVTCGKNDVFLLYSKVRSIESFYLTEDRNRPLKTIESATNIKNVIAMTVDVSNERIFFSDIKRGDIQTVFFNGSSFAVVLSAVGSAEGLVYDKDHSYLYFTSYTNSSISRIKLNSNGTKDGNVELLVQLEADDHPRAIVLEKCTERIFWTNWNELEPKIQRSSLNGLNTVSIITSAIRTPNGLAIDNKAQRLYWSDTRLDKIERSDFNGNNREVIITTVPKHPFGLAVYGEFIYWSDWILRAIVRVNKYDGNIHSVLRKDFGHIMGITIVAQNDETCDLFPAPN